MRKTKWKENNCIGFSSSMKTVTIKWNLSENLEFQNLLKNRKLLPAEMFGNTLAFDGESKVKFNHLYQLAVSSKIIYIWLSGLKFLLCLNRKFFDFKKIQFRYYGFSLAINVFFWDGWQRCLYHQDGYRQKLR